MAPSNATVSNQVGGMRDQVKCVGSSNLSSGNIVPIEQLLNEKQLVTHNNNNARGSDRHSNKEVSTTAATANNPDPNKKKTNSNMFAGISEFFAGFANNQHGSKSKVNSRQVRFATGATMLATPTSPRNENLTETIDNDDPATPLGQRWESGGGNDRAGHLPAAERKMSPVVAAAMTNISSGVSGKRASLQSSPAAAAAAATEAVDFTQRCYSNNNSSNSSSGGDTRGVGDPGDRGKGDGGEGEVESNDGQEKIMEWKRACALKKKRGSFTEENFVPCYATFTPHISTESLQGIKYKAPETRVPSAVAPPSSVARPNYHDALRRVAVVVYQHIKTCEWRRRAAEEREKAKAKAAAAQMAGPAPSHAPMQSWRRSSPALAALRRNESALWGVGEGGRGGARRVGAKPAESGPSEPFNAKQADDFHERHFVSPTYRYNFMQAPVMALPGVLFTLREVRSTPKSPTADMIYEFIKTLFNKACLSSECSLVCLIYVERLMETAQVPLLASTWKPVLLCGLLLASKVWQDLSSWNVEFSTVYPEYSLKSINRLELLFLSAMRWDMSISSSLYAKYYFALRSLAEKKDFRRRYNQVLQIDAPRATRVEARTKAVKREVIHTKSAVCMLSKSL